MTEQEFCDRFELESEMLKTWGNFVSCSVTRALKEYLGGRFTGFLKMEPHPRLKDLNSALNKAFVVKLEKYNNPYDDMEDKIGIRFVVLLGSQVDMVGRLLESPLDACWTYSKDFDFESKRSENPYFFDKYQSLHYVVRAGVGVVYEGVSIPEGTPCEVQIRTLLQHAHSELTHDSFYKPKADSWKREKKTVERLVARGMALVETTDAVFEDVMEEISRESEPTERFVDDLATLYREVVGVKFDKESLSNRLIVDSYVHARPSLSFDEVQSFFRGTANSGRAERIRERAANTHLYRLPAILLAYYAAKTYTHMSKTAWPFTQSSLEDIFTDVGKSLN